jgi:hypothetical protein
VNVALHVDATSFVYAEALYRLAKCQLALGKREDATTSLEVALRTLDAREERSRYADFMGNILELLEAAKPPPGAEVK